jgi:hypothetical protein
VVAVLSDSSTFIQMTLADDYDCGDKLPTRSGSTIEQMQSGVCKFESMYRFCNPGGTMNVKVTDAESTTSLESHSMKWSFRQCLKGEYYRDGECNWCEQGFYSKEENLDLSITECKRCPPDASECFADTIVLDKGYWALTVDSEGMSQCPMGEKACIGGVQSATGEEEEEEETTSPVTDQTSSVREVQKQHLLHHSAAYSMPSEYTTQESVRVYNSSANASIYNEGYSGILCAICEEEYYYSPGSNTCEICEEGGVNTFLIVLLCVLGVLLCVPLALLSLSWTGSTTLDTVITNLSVPALLYMFYMKFMIVKKPGENETEAEREQRESNINDFFVRIMLKFKIFISMVQITSSMPAVLGMTFPPFFTKVTSIFGLLNLDIATNLGLSCRFKDIDYVDYLIMTCVAPMICSLFLCLVYNCHRYMLKRRRAHYEEVAGVYAKYLLVFLMGTYLALPNISVYIFQMFSCQDIDPDDALAGEDLYLRADLSINCGSSRHTTGTTFATCMILVYPVGVPLMYFWMLHNVKEGIMNRTENISSKLRLAIIPSSFLYSSYEPQCWYWEIVETIRRITMTGVIVLIAQGTSLQIVITMLLSLFFIKMYSHYAPFDDELLDVDAEFAQYQVYFVLFIALLMKEESIPAMGSVWGYLLVFVILSLLLLPFIRLFKEKCLPAKFQHMGRVDHEHFDHHIDELRRKELEANDDDSAWNEDVDIADLPDVESCASGRDVAKSLNDDDKMIEKSTCSSGDHNNSGADDESSLMQKKPNKYTTKNPPPPPRVTVSPRLLQSGGAKVHPTHREGGGDEGEDNSGEEQLEIEEFRAKRSPRLSIVEYIDGITANND